MATLCPRLKVAVLIKRFLRTGGAEKYAMEVVRRLAVSHEVHVFAHEWAFDGPEPITFHKIPRVCRKPAWLNQLFFSYACRRAVGHGFDVVHSFEKVSSFDVMTVQSPCFKSSGLAAEKPWKRILGWLTMSPRKLAWLWLEREQFSDNPARVVIAVSEQVKRNVQAQYPLPDERFRLAYTGVEVPPATGIATKHDRNERRAQWDIGVDDLVVLFVGTEFKRKGLDVLLQGLAKVPRARFKLLIAGGGGERIASYRKLVDRLQLGSEVRFLGLVDGIERIYSIADVYVLPTLADPCPLAPLEAMAAGVATVMSSSTYNGTAELIRQGEAVILSNPQDPEEIASALLTLMNGQVRQQVAEKGQRLMRQLTWEQTAAVTAAAYQDVIQLRRVNRPVAGTVKGAYGCSTTIQ
ncbi:glycosyltransferase family 4 protein [Nitrospira lenta]|uniref:glycosyltransferase family 4 protein n=1 Tax=Nitrospira lenta TaxID=1436998 RepID=UPI0011B817CD|nr:glycosyltransferase family 4 protein [Nitrospira lenta]